MLKATTAPVAFALLVIALTTLPTKGGYAQGGALPKGDYKNKGAAKPASSAVKPTTKKKSAQTQACAPAVMFPGEEAGVFSPKGDDLFLLAKNEKKNSKPGLARYTVYRLDLTLRKAEAVYGLEQKGNVGLMLLGGDPVTAISTVSFVGPCASSLEGAAGAVSVSIQKKSDKAVQVAGDFFYFDSISGRAIADMKKNAVLELDGQQFQTRTGARYEKGNRPIYLDSLKKNLIVWHEDKKQRGLVAYFGDGAQVGTRLSIPQWDTLLRDRGFFAAATVKAQSNTVVIHEIPEWSGVASKSDHALKLPKEISAGGALFVPRFSSKLVAVLQKSWAGRTGQNDVHLFNYKTGKQIGRISPPTGIIPGFVGFTPDDKWLVVELRSAEQRHTTGLRIMAVSTGLSEAVKLDPPK